MTIAVIAATVWVGLNVLVAYAGYRWRKGRRA